MMSLLTDPNMIMLYITVGGFILAKLIYPFLEKLVGKTPSMADDQFLIATKKIVEEAMAKKAAKITKPKTPAAPVE
jgi:hypothetical protein